MGRRFIKISTLIFVLLVGYLLFFNHEAPKERANAKPTDPGGRFATLPPSTELTTTIPPTTTTALKIPVGPRNVGEDHEDEVVEFAPQTADTYAFLDDPKKSDLALADYNTLRQLSNQIVTVRLTAKDMAKHMDWIKNAKRVGEYRDVKILHAGAFRDGKNNNDRAVAYVLWEGTTRADGKTSTQKTILHFARVNGTWVVLD